METLNGDTRQSLLEDEVSSVRTSFEAIDGNGAGEENAFLGSSSPVSYKQEPSFGLRLLSTGFDFQTCALSIVAVLATVCISCVFPGLSTERSNTTRHPTEFLRDVVPIPCHSHNDYWREEPLFSALSTGCISVEADVWHFDGELYVGHDPAALDRTRTFASLYVDPLVELLSHANAHSDFYRGHHRGVFHYDPEQAVVLLVDIKTEGLETWGLVARQLEPLRNRGWLTHVVGGVGGADSRSELRARPVTVVSTGNAPFDALAANDTYRDAFFDAPLRSLPTNAGPPDAAEVEYNPLNSLYASTNFAKAIGDVRAGFSADQLRTLRAQIRAAHDRGLKVRYWDLPGWPIGTRNTVWRTMVEEGVDILNVDDLHSAARTSW